MNRLTFIDSTLADAIAHGCDTVQHKYNGLLTIHAENGEKFLCNQLLGTQTYVFWDCLKFNGRDLTLRPYRERYAFLHAWICEVRKPEYRIVQNYPIRKAVDLWSADVPHTCGVVFRDSMALFGGPVRVARRYKELPRGIDDPTGIPLLDEHIKKSYTAVQIKEAHQYLYYVKAKSVLSDEEYDKFCKAHGIFGGGGSDVVRHYSEETILLAIRLARGDKVQVMSK